MCCKRTCLRDFQTRSYANQAVQKMVRGLKFQIYEGVEGLYYQCSENKGTDQLLLNHGMRAPAFGYVKNKGADQLHMYS